MKIAHQERNRDCTVNVYPVLDDDGPTVYYLQTTLGRGTGSLTEPRVTAEFSAQELRDFAVSLIGLVALGVTE